VSDSEAFHAFRLGVFYWSRKYRYPASKWFGRIVGRLYFRKWWVDAPI
jgi:hypothetical protein